MLNSFLQFKPLYHLFPVRNIFLVAIMCFMVLIYGQLQATNYYFSTSGNDSGNTGLSAKSPWKSLEKLDEIMIRLQPGDSVLFCRGDVFHGKVRITKSGTKQAVIYFGAYGKGAKPVLNGTVRLLGWKEIGQNKWETTYPANLGELNSLLLNGEMQPVGRWPNRNEANGGYLTIKWASGSTRLSSKAIPNASIWIGADAVVRTQRWVLDRSSIRSATGDTLTIEPVPQNIIDPSFGFFICNHPQTLDKYGEWCFDKTTKKITLYSEKNPDTFVVEVPVVNDAITIRKQRSITIENLVINGMLNNGIMTDSVDEVTVRNMEILHSGKTGAYFKNAKNNVFEGNIIYDANNEGVYFQYCHGSVIRRNSVKNIGLVPGMGRPSFDGSFSYNGIEILGSSNRIEFNQVDNVGYVGIRFEGDSTIVQYNVISNYCSVKDDGGGIYTWNADHYFHPAEVRPNVGQKVINNIVSNAIGAGFGTDDSLSNSANGIYIDGGSCNVEVIGNTVYRCGAIGVFVNNASQITVLNNLVYHAKTQLQVRAEGMPLGVNRMNVIKHNTFVSNSSSQRIANFISDEGVDGIGRLGLIDSNYYCRPTDPDMIMFCSYKSGDSDVRISYSLDDWKKRYRQYDQHSKAAPVTIPYYVTSKEKPRKITYGFYREGKDIWYNEPLDGNEAPDSLTGCLTGISAGLKDGMNKYMILAMNMDFKKGEEQKYLLEFDAKGGNPGETIKANFKTPNNQIVCSKEFKLENIFRKNELLYVPAFANTPHERVNFEFSNSKEPVWIKNITFRKVEAVLPNPDNHFLLVVNDSEKPKISSGLSGYVDVTGKSCKRTVVLPPFSSGIFFKK